MDDPPANPLPPRWLVTGTGLGLIALLCLVPLAIETPPLSFLPAWESLFQAVAFRAIVLLVLGLVIAGRARLDERMEPGSGRLTMMLAVLAIALTACHWLIVDREPALAHWQRDLYRGVFDHTYSAPHRYRPLPYGFTRLLEHGTGDWLFACLAYRWFFTFWFAWAWQRFARLFLSPSRALLALLPLPLLYPFSILYYWGQLTDPLSHTLLVLGMIYIIENRPFALGAALALGIVAKETAVLLVPAYFACYWRRGLPTVVRTGLLGVTAIAVFYGVRLFVDGGWRPAYRDINGTEGLMILTNLGIGEPLYSGAAPLFENYLQPFLFVGVFLPPIAWCWRSVDARLRALFLTLVPLVLASNLCFGWMYESRNYLPLVPLLATMALEAKGQARVSARQENPGSMGP
jgi:hypothetical protein